LKNSNLWDHNSPTLQTDRQTTCDHNTALCTKVHRAVKIHFETPLGWYCTIVQSVGTRTFPCQRLPPHINTLPFGHANSQFLASEKVPAVSHSFKPGWSSWLRPISMWHRRLERLDVVVATCHRGHGDTMIAILSTQSYDVPAICLSTVAAVDNNTMTIHWASLVIRTLGRSTTVWR